MWLSNLIGFCNPELPIAFTQLIFNAKLSCPYHLLYELDDFANLVLVVFFLPEGVALLHVRNLGNHCFSCSCESY